MALQDINQITASGAPQFFCVFGDQLLLRPVPDGVYTVQHLYYLTEPALVDNTDTPLLPVQFHATLVQSAVALAAERAGDMPRATAAHSAYNKWLERMNAYKRRLTAPGSIRVRPGRDF